MAIATKFYPKNLNFKRIFILRALETHSILHNLNQHSILLTDFSYVKLNYPDAYVLYKNLHK